MDTAASELCHEGKYDLDFKSPPGSQVTGPYWCTLVHPGGCFPTMVSVEDPFDQDDRDGWKQFLTQADIQVVDNDLTATNPKLIARAAKLQARSCLLLKVNQIRLVTKSIRARLAQSYSWGVMVSHRSGETEDTFISDLVVGLCAGQVSPSIPC
ncbi:ENOB enolase, partial [Corvus moneduloides]|nr:ENOB enolase [Corvus moneduloides]